MIQIKKKALKLWRDPRAFVADASSVRRIFTALYGQQLPQASAGLLPPVQSVSRLKVSELFHGAVLANSLEVSAEIQRVLNSACSRIPVVLFSSSTPNTAHVGVLRSHFPVLYQILIEKGQVAWELEPLHRDPINPPHLSQIANATRITAVVEVMKGGFARIAISLYSFQAEGNSKAFLSLDNSNRMAKKISKELGDSFFRSAGLKLYDVAIGNPPIQNVRGPIDVVYTWVSHEDLEWQELYRQHAPSAKRASDALALSRFKSRDELKYSIRSIFQYMPWVRTIYVLTNCSAPQWFSEGTNVKWVHHRDVLDPSALPTFSSHAIETSLHHIPGLSENFLYFNDDFFINRPVAPEMFFEIGGLSKSKLEPYGVVNGHFAAGDPDYLNAARTGAELIASDFGVWPSQLHEHAPYALKVSVLNQMERDYADHFSVTRANRFRGKGDISVVSFLYHHYAALTGAAVGATYTTRLIKNSIGNLAQTLSTLNESVGPATFCLNDGNDSHEDGVWDFEIRRFLEDRFPHPSPCERLVESEP